MKTLCSDFKSVKRMAKELDSELFESIPNVVSIGVEKNAEKINCYNLFVVVNNIGTVEKIPKKFHGIKVRTEVADQTMFA